MGWMHETQLLTRSSKEGGEKKPRGKITIIYTIKRNKTRRKKERKRSFERNHSRNFLNTMYLSKGQKRKKRKKKSLHPPTIPLPKHPWKKKGFGADTEFCCVFHHSFIHIHYVVPTIKKKELHFHYFIDRQRRDMNFFLYWAFAWKFLGRLDRNETQRLVIRPGVVGEETTKEKEQRGGRMQLT